jgi:ribosomal protein L37AE/L43A
MQKDLSAVAEFAKRFATEAACRDYLIQLRWPEGFRCPHCGGRENWRLKNARFECRACGRQNARPLPCQGSVLDPALFRCAEIPPRVSDWADYISRARKKPAAASARRAEGRTVPNQLMR